MELHAPPDWKCIDLVSDLHLHASHPQTFQAWCDYILNTTASAVFILGDLFEVWVGDDAKDIPDSFEQQCTAVLRTAGLRRPVHIMCGNRDFLMGQALMDTTHCTLLDDPCTVHFSNQAWLLTHGDALCLDDTDYLDFRAKVRKPQWQHDFLAQPLAQRQEIARNLRGQSESRKQLSPRHVDVDAAAALQTIRNAGAQNMIHGHTHRPGTHPLGPEGQRWVLSDWDLDSTLARAEVLRICSGAGGAPTSSHRMSPTDAAIS
jgi:UDP-2,3-diacylglucosamine hydrolase